MSFPCRIRVGHSYTIDITISVDLLGGIYLLIGLLTPLFGVIIEYFGVF